MDLVSHTCVTQAGGTGDPASPPRTAGCDLLCTFADIRRHHLGVPNAVTSGSIPDTVRFSFWAGGIALFAAVLWTVLATREYSPEQMRAFDERHHNSDQSPALLAARRPASALPWIGAGATGYASFFVISDPSYLIVSEIGVGNASASILAMPYAILASSLPQAKLGTYMGLFNVFIALPQLLVSTIMGSIMKAFFPGEPIRTMAFAAATLAVAALAMSRVSVPSET